MSMYEARQNKEKVSRRIDSTRTIQGLILQRHLKIKNPETEDVKSYIKMQTAETAPNIYSILMNMIDSEKEYTFNTIKDAIDNVCQMFGTYSTIDDILLKKEESINGVNEVNNLSNHYKNMIMKSVEEHKNEKNIFGFRGDLSEILAAAKKENQGNKILTNIECVIKRQRFNSISDFQNQICSDYGYKDYTSFRQMNNTNDSQKTIKSGRVNQRVQHYEIFLKKTSAGVEKLSFSLGLALIFFLILVIFPSVTVLMSVPFGIYCRISLLPFSMAPFCHAQ